MTPNPPPPAPVPTQTEAQALQELHDELAAESQAYAALPVGKFRQDVLTMMLGWRAKVDAVIAPAISALLTAETRERAHVERIKGYEMESHRLIAERLKAEASVTALREALTGYSAILRQPSDRSAFGLETSWLIYDHARAEIADELDRINRPDALVPSMERQAAKETPPAAGEWWGVIGPLGMPCLFGKHREDVDGQADDDERIALFRVEEVAFSGCTCGGRNGSHAAGCPIAPAAHEAAPQEQRQCSTCATPMELQWCCEQCGNRVSAASASPPASSEPLAEGPGAQDGVALIAAERQRQLSAEGWTPEHDDEHRHGEMAVSAARYAMHDVGFDELNTRDDAYDAAEWAEVKVALGKAWRWESCWWKPKDPIRNLVRAGALIAAEIDRRQRQLKAAPPAPGPIPETRTERGK